MVFRSIIIITLGVLFNLITKPILPSFIYYSSLIIGCISAGYFSQTIFKTRGLVTFALLIFVTSLLVTNFIVTLDSYHSTVQFFWLKVGEHLFFATILFLLSSLSTLLFIRSRLYASIELIFILITITVLVAAHRNFQLDSPKIVSDFAWARGISQVTAFVIVGGIYSLFSIAYLALNFSLNSYKLSANSKNLGKQNKKVFLFKYGLTLLGFGSIFFIIFNSVSSFYTIQAEQLTGNGVTQANSRDDNPLKFFDSLGGSSDPTALVRFDSDYSQNPHSPLLYFRQNALSKMNDSRKGEDSMGFGKKEFDKETPLISTRDAFEIKENLNNEERTEVKYEAYLITDHRFAFFLDYPTKITPIKNPKPERFVGAFKATSLVPTYDISALNTGMVGNPNWSADEWNYYTKNHFDPRYGEYARKIVPIGTMPVEQATILRDHIVNTATYTLNPNNPTPENKDQVGAFLFGKMRGYCVHFAHSMVYMLRSLNIPARIAAGYLADTQYAKDGHMLLRMSDRHAWAEVYVHPFGWVPFDVHPKKVESHAQSDVNPELLDELIGLLGPSEEELPELSPEDYAPVPEKYDISLPKFSSVALCIFACLIMFLLTKYYIWFGWKFSKSPNSRIFKVHRSSIAKLVDLGFSRKIGETTLEFQNRMKDVWDEDILPTTSKFVDKFFNYKNSHSDRNVNIDDIKPNKFIGSKPFIIRTLAFLNPKSLRILFFGNKLDA